VASNTKIEQEIANLTARIAELKQQLVSPTGSEGQQAMRERLEQQRDQENSAQYDTAVWGDWRDRRHLGATGTNQMGPNDKLIPPTEPTLENRRSNTGNVLDTLSKEEVEPRLFDRQQGSAVETPEYKAAKRGKASAQDLFKRKQKLTGGTSGK
jgi:hypothetical protein